MKSSRSIYRGISYAAAVTVIVAVMIPIAADTFQISAERHDILKLRRQVGSTESQQEDLKTVGLTNEKQLLELRQRSFVDGDEERLRSEWLAIVQKHGGKIRRFDFGESRRRIWQGVGDDIYSLDQYVEESSGMILNQQPIALHVEGSLPTVKKILNDILATRLIAKITELSLAPVESSADSEIQMRLEMNLFGLSEDDGSLDEDYAWTGSLRRINTHGREDV